jgi:hypothetical protein
VTNVVVSDDTKRIINGRMGQFVETKTWAGIGDAIEQNSLRSETCDAHLLFWIELTAPLNAIQKQLTKREADGIARFGREICLELLEETLYSLGCLAGSGH